MSSTVTKGSRGDAVSDIAIPQTSARAVPLCQRPPRVDSKLRRKEFDELAQAQCDLTTTPSTQERGHICGSGLGTLLSLAVSSAWQSLALPQGSESPCARFLRTQVHHQLRQRRPEQKPFCTSDSSLRVPRVFQSLFHNNDSDEWRSNRSYLMPPKLIAL